MVFLPVYSSCRIAVVVSDSFRQYAAFGIVLLSLPQIIIEAVWLKNGSAPVVCC